MRKHKSVVAILLAVMMIFTFMPTMAFAQPVKDTTIPSDSELTSAGIAEMVVEKEVEWSSDFHTAKVYVNGYNSSDALVKSYVANFQLYDEEATVKKDDAGKYFAVYPYSGTTTDGASFTNYVLGVATSTYDNTKENGGSWTWEPLETAGYTWSFAKTQAITDSRSVDVFDASQFASMNVLKKEFQIDAGEYSYWFAHKDEMEGNVKYPLPTKLNNEFGKVNTWKADDGLYTVTYPEYNAYDYDAEKLKNNVLEAKVELNAGAIKARYGKKYEVSTAPATVKIEMVVDHIDDNYKAWTIDGSKASWNAYNSNAYNKSNRGDIKYSFVYDGASHGITFTNAPKQVSYKYYVAKEDAKGNWAEPKTTDFVDSFAGIKDAGVYHIYVVQILNKTSAQIVDNKIVEIYQYPVELYFTQSRYNAEYGKFTVEDVVAAVKGFVKIAATPDSADKIKEAVEKYAAVNGVFEQAGRGWLSISMGDTELAKDASMAAALSNYRFVTNDEMQLVVEKADNDVTIKTSAKTFKANKKTKKLAKNKSFKISYTVEKGSVKFSKLAGNGKIKVSEAGKVTVKKGLKKGTYKLKVKALAKGNANYAQASATKVIKIKIK